MNAWLRNCPWWVWSLVYAVVYAVIRVIVSWTFGPRDSGDLLIQVFFWLLLGAVMGPVLRNQTSGSFQALDGLSSEQSRAARRAVLRGPAPTDPAVRQAAARLVEIRLKQSRRTMIPALVGQGLLIALFVFGAIVWSQLWWALAAGVIAVLAVWIWWLGRNL